MFQAEDDFPEISAISIDRELAEMIHRLSNWKHLNADQRSNCREQSATTLAKLPEAKKQPR